jgi:hypothetical protein
MMPGELKDLSKEDLYSAVWQMTLQREKAIIAKDEQGQHNAMLLIQQIRQELRSRL